MALCADARKAVNDAKAQKAQTAAVRAANEALVAQAGLQTRRPNPNHWGDQGCEDGDMNGDETFEDGSSEPTGTGRRKRRRATQDEGFESIAHSLVELNRESIALRTKDFEHKKDQDDKVHDLNIAQHNLQAERFKDERKERTLDREDQKKDRAEQAAQAKEDRAANLAAQRATTDLMSTMANSMAATMTLITKLAEKIN